MSKKEERQARAKLLDGLDEAQGEAREVRFGKGRDFSRFPAFVHEYDGYHGEGAWAAKERALLAKYAKKDLMTTAEETVVYSILDRRAWSLSHTTA